MPAVGFVASVIPCSVAGADKPAGDIVASPLDDASARPPQGIGYGAMPGGLHVATAEISPRGTVELTAVSGFGFRDGLLESDHTFERALGGFAVAYAPLPQLMLGLSLDGRYDKHEGLAAMNDDGYVGAPHLLARFGSSRGRVVLGGQLGVWVPGKDAPSVAAPAISVDARGLLSIDAGFGTLSINAGFRLDNSARSVDDPGSLSVADRVSLGVSDFHAAIGGLSLRVPAGSRAYVALEGSADVFVGSGAPGPILRGGVQAGISISDAFSIVGFVEAAKVPGLTASDVMAGNIVLIPYEPAITGGLGLQARFGGRAVAPAASPIVKNARPVPVVVPITLAPILPPGQLRAVIINLGTSRPVAGATVAIEPGGATATSGPDGKFTVDLAPGRYKLTVAAPGLKQQQLDVTIEQNGVAIKNIELHR